MVSSALVSPRAPIPSDVLSRLTPAAADTALAVVQCVGSFAPLWADAERAAEKCANKHGGGGAMELRVKLAVLEAVLRHIAVDSWELKTIKNSKEGRVKAEHIFAVARRLSAELDGGTTPGPVRRADQELPPFVDSGTQAAAEPQLTAEEVPADAVFVHTRSISPPPPGAVWAPSVSSSPLSPTPRIYPSYKSPVPPPPPPRAGSFPSKGPMTMPTKHASPLPAAVGRPPERGGNRQRQLSPSVTVATPPATVRERANQFERGEVVPRSEECEFTSSPRAPCPRAALYCHRSGGGTHLLQSDAAAPRSHNPSSQPPETTTQPRAGNPKCYPELASQLKAALASCGKVAHLVQEVRSRAEWDTLRSDYAGAYSRDLLQDIAGARDVEDRANCEDYLSGFGIAFPPPPVGVKSSAPPPRQRDPYASEGSSSSVLSIVSVPVKRPPGRGVKVPP
eukprot:Hpha_TRINITY_DN34938_c0_g1::TRINITY_DN34938_c0_g1_i1::g.184046::m.184046